MLCELVLLLCYAIANMDAVNPAEKRSSTEKQLSPPTWDHDARTPSNPIAHVMATIQDDDERLLARIGYKQVGNFACIIDANLG